MYLTENVHFESKRYRVGEWNGREYCYDNFNGEALTLKLTHPDVTEDAIRKHGDRLRNLRMARNSRCRRQKLDIEREKIDTD